MSKPEVLRYEARLRPGTFGAWDVVKVTSEGEECLTADWPTTGEYAKKHARRANRLLGLEKEARARKAAKAGGADQ